MRESNKIKEWMQGGCNSVMGCVNSLQKEKIWNGLEVNETEVKT